MSVSKAKNTPEDNFHPSRKSPFMLALFSLCALATTFFVADSDLTFETKFSIFISTVFLYLLFYFVVYTRREIGQPNRLPHNSDDSAGAIIEAKLLAFEEAKQFFGASLKAGDMFRLVTSRINEIIPFAVCTLYLVDEKKSKLKIVNAVGVNADKFVGIETSLNRGLVGKTFQTKTANYDENLQSERGILGDDALENLNSAIAVPLLEADEVFGVLMLYGNKKENEMDRGKLPLLEAIGTRVAPLFYGSRIYEDNLTNALTDALTNLPNERAFYLVLENQIAESQRFRDERPLTVLTIDIKNFGELNRRFGHAIGDRILEYVADNIKNQLRQMDFLARIAGDEFYAVLPTASDEITREIVERIRKVFVRHPFEVTTEQTINLQLNFGAASFWKNGETAAELLKHAALRKRQSKNAAHDNVLWFPKEFIN